MCLAALIDLVGRIVHVWPVRLPLMFIILVITTHLCSPHGLSLLASPHTPRARFAPRLAIVTPWQCTGHVCVIDKNNVIAPRVFL